MSTVYTSQFPPNRHFIFTMSSETAPAWGKEAEQSNKDDTTHPTASRPSHNTNPKSNLRPHRSSSAAVPRPAAGKLAAQPILKLHHSTDADIPSPRRRRRAGGRLVPGAGRGGTEQAGTRDEEWETRANRESLDGLFVSSGEKKNWKVMLRSSLEEPNECNDGDK
ncbi:predicted protein [Pyrenophora tritici-repentis Pt-1C-BFP]|uniref:Uncharacterized protein n=1 Tax=Pyrenophora tritici-repentis (strain Pt-1C-BFP) TaxID=426418 RepID=B2W389_PYRTR|nr:uncharacterized protein PTRG_04939 [Pyrenophora tritici-repentis Pt-1C-BFP]EDU47846.1 predicted protein [Pyrenophora tritici-repentis Pt-1C-BFP]